MSDADTTPAAAAENPIPESYARENRIAARARAAAEGAKFSTPRECAHTEAMLSLMEAVDVLWYLRRDVAMSGRETVLEVLDLVGEALGDFIHAEAGISLADLREGAEILRRASPNAASVALEAAQIDDSDDVPSTCAGASPYAGAVSLRDVLPAIPRPGEAARLEERLRELERWRPRIEGNLRRLDEVAIGHHEAIVRLEAKALPAEGRSR